MDEQTPGPLLVGLHGAALTGAERRLLQHPLVGGVVLFARNVDTPAQLRTLTGEIHELRWPPLLITVDQEGGRVQRCLDGFTRLPPARVYGRRYDSCRKTGLASARAGGLVMATELRRVGIDLSFAPVLDLDLGLSGVIGDRAFHEDPAVVTVLAGAWIEGMRAAGMPATGKHFPGHGGVMLDSHLDLPVDQRPLSELEQRDMLPYTRLIDQGALDAVMTAHVVLPAMDRLPASLSPVWVRGVLRRQLGFRGVVVADDLGMEGAAMAGGPGQRARAALAAGADLVMLCNELDAIPEVLSGIADADEPEAAQRRLLLQQSIGAPPPADLEAEARAVLRN